MFPSSLKSMGGRRKDSAIRTLVAETLVLAKTHGCVEKIESELEEELRRESSGRTTGPLSKWRRKGEKALKSKYVLLTVALFCVTDCALVLGELILDLHRVKDTLETSEQAIQDFKLTLHKAYPKEVPDVDADIKDIFNKISYSRIEWCTKDMNCTGLNTLPSFASTSSSSVSSSLSTVSPALSGSQSSGRRRRRSVRSGSTASLRPTGSRSGRSTLSGSLRSRTSGSSGLPSGRRLLVLDTHTSSGKGRLLASRTRRSTSSVSEDASQETEYVVVYDDGKISDTVRQHNESAYARGVHGNETDLEGNQGMDHVYSLEEEIAHVLHLTSVTMLGFLAFETMLKAFCAGLPFFKRKLETFDLFIVVVSFVVDVVFMQILPRFKIQDFVFILAFLLPWRVIRVVDSLVVAVQDHEHFRLKLLYSRKKKIQNSLRETEVKLQLFKAQCCALKRLCINEGVEESKIEQIVQLDEYVVNRTGKSKCKVRIDNASVILLDKSDFPRLSPRPSLANLLEKRRSIQVDSARDPKCDKLLKRNGHSLAVGDAIRRDSVCVPAAGDSSKGKRDGGGWKGKGWRPFWDNGPRASKIPEESLLGVTKVKRAGSQSQIYDAPKRDLRSLLKISSAEGGVKRAGSQSQICHVTINPSASDFAENVVKRQASSDLSEDAVVVHTANDKAGGEEVGLTPDANSNATTPTLASTPPHFYTPTTPSPPPSPPNGIPPDRNAGDTETQACSSGNTAAPAVTPASTTDTVVQIEPDGDDRKHVTSGEATAAFRDNDGSGRVSDISGHPEMNGCNGHVVSENSVEDERLKPDVVVDNEFVKSHPAEGSAAVVTISDAATAGNVPITDTGQNFVAVKDSAADTNIESGETEKRKVCDDHDGGRLRGETTQYRLGDDLDSDKLAETEQHKDCDNVTDTQGDSNRMSCDYHSERPSETEGNETCDDEQVEGCTEQRKTTPVDDNKTMPLGETKQRNIRTNDNTCVTEEHYDKQNEARSSDIETLDNTTQRNIRTDDGKFCDADERQNCDDTRSVVQPVSQSKSSSEAYDAPLPHSSDSAERTLRSDRTSIEELQQTAIAGAFSPQRTDQQEHSHANGVLPSCQGKVL